MKNGCTAEDLYAQANDKNRKDWKVDDRHGCDVVQRVRSAFGMASSANNVNGFDHVHIA